MIELDSSDFIRNQYTTLTWHTKDGSPILENPKLFAEITSLDTYCEIKANRSGSFNFYFMLDGM